MAYNNDEHEMEHDDQSEFLEEDPVYGTDTYFGERMESTSDEEMMEDDTLEEDDQPLTSSTEATGSELGGESADGFGETLEPDESDSVREPLTEEED